MRLVPGRGPQQPKSRAQVNFIALIPAYKLLKKNYMKLPISYKMATHVSHGPYIPATESWKPFTIDRSERLLP
jgi:hypothetical protein